MNCCECGKPYVTGQTWTFELDEDGDLVIMCPDCTDIFLGEEMAA